MGTCRAGDRGAAGGCSLIVGVVSYNRFVTQRNLIKDAWANIDTELRRRYDLIPNLVETVRGYAVARARDLRGGDEGARDGDRRHRLARPSRRPPRVRLSRRCASSWWSPRPTRTLKADQTFLHLQAEFANTEDRLQTSRRFYNANVREYNTRVQSFPSMIVARLGDFQEEEFFEVDDVAARRRGRAAGRLLARRRERHPRAADSPAPARPPTPTATAPPTLRRLRPRRARGPGSAHRLGGRGVLVEQRPAAHPLRQQPPDHRPAEREAADDLDRLAHARAVRDARRDHRRDRERQRDEREVEREDPATGSGRARSAGARTTRAPTGPRRPGARPSPRTRRTRASARRPRRRSPSPNTASAPAITGRSRRWPGPAIAMADEGPDERADPARGEQDPEADRPGVEHRLGEHHDEREDAAREPEPELHADERQHAVVPAGVGDGLAGRLDRADPFVLRGVAFGERPPDAPSAGAPTPRTMRRRSRTPRPDRAPR